jgi:hypothetical protein
MCRNVVCCDAVPAGLEKSYAFIQTQEFLARAAQTGTYYGDGYTTDRIVKHLKRVALGISKKPFLEQ